MVELRPTPKFEKSFKRLDKVRQTRAAKSLSRFLADPRYGPLHFEKLKGTGLHSIRVHENFRIILRRASGDTYDLLDVGSHDAMYSRYG